MRYYATIAGKQIPVDVESVQGRFRALTVEGQRYEVDWAPVGDGAASMMINERSYSVHYEEEGDDEVVVYLDSQVFPIEVANEQRFRLRRAASTLSTEGRQAVVAPMPGKIVRILVRLGDEVRQGQGLVVVEAMKMENELKSPKGGRVVELAAREGSTVEKSAKLVVIE